LVRNPTDAVTPPKVEKRELQTWDPDIFHTFMEHAKDSQFRDLYYFAVLTGLRRSELCGLKWKDVDLGTKKMRVVRTLQRIKGQGLVEGLPKTQRSRRTIELSRGATELLNRVRVAQMERKLAYGEAWRGQGHVFNGVDGAPISGERPSRDFAAIVRSASLPHLTLHGLRHTAAALLIAGGVHARAIADILGHSSIATTMDVYGHLMKGVQGEAVSIIDDSLAAVRSA
jgi:integrase